MKLFCLIFTTTTLQYQFLNLVEFSSSLCPVLIYIHIISEILSHSRFYYFSVLSFKE